MDARFSAIGQVGTAKALQENLNKQFGDNLFAKEIGFTYVTSVLDD